MCTSWLVGQLVSATAHFLPRAKQNLFFFFLFWYRAQLVGEFSQRPILPNSEALPFLTNQSTACTGEMNGRSALQQLICSQAADHVYMARLAERCALIFVYNQIYQQLDHAALFIAVSNPAPGLTSIYV